MLQETVLYISEEQTVQIRNRIIPNEDLLNKYIEEIHQWLEKQPHLPQNEGTRWIETMLILTKFNVELTKKKLEMLYTARTLLPIFFEGRDILDPSMQKLMKAVMLCPLPKLNDDLCRVHIFKFLSEPEDFDNDAYSKYFFMTIDIRCGYAKELCLGDHFIIDYGTAKVGHVLKTNPVLMKKALEVLKNGYAERVKGLHLINVPSFANTLLTISTSMLSPKLRNRIYMHKDYESLQKIISPKILPIEYGGLETSLSQINDNWNNYLESARDWFIVQEMRKSNEELRPSWSPIDTDMYGVEGTFRKLDLD